MNEINQEQTAATASTEDLKGWNWGAFLLNWIWGIGNQTWIALLAFIPVFGFIWMFVLGVKGNQWAWENGRWQSIEQFKQVQRKWAIAGFTVWGIMIALCLSLCFFVFTMMHHSWAAKTSFSSIQQNTQLHQRLGTPITRSWLIMGNVISNANGTGTARVHYHIKGPKGNAKVTAIAVKQDGQWSMESLKIRPNRGDKIVIIQQKDPLPSDEKR